MDIIFLENFWQGLLAFYRSGFFTVIKFILGIYAAVVLADIVLLLIQRGLGADMRDTLLGADIPPEFVRKKGKLRRKWEKIRKIMGEEKESSYKIALIFADDIIGELIKKMGYKGENTGDRLAGINPGRIENVGELKKAHELKNRVVCEKDFILEKEKAWEAIGYYENFLKYFDVLED